MMASSQGWTTNNFCWKCWSVAHIFTQSTEQYNIDSSCIDLNNSVVVGNVSSNTHKKLKPMAQDLHSYASMRVLMVRIQVQERVLRSRVQSHCFRVRKLKICTRVQVPSTTTLLIADFHLLLLANVTTFTNLHILQVELCCLVHLNHCSYHTRSWYSCTLVYHSILCYFLVQKWQTLVTNEQRSQYTIKFRWH